MQAKRMPLQETTNIIPPSKSPIKSLLVNDRKRGPTTPIKPIYNPTSKRRIEELLPSWGLQNENENYHNNKHHLQTKEPSTPQRQPQHQQQQLRPYATQNDQRSLKPTIPKSEATYKLWVEQQRTNYYKSLVQFMELERKFELEYK